LIHALTALGSYQLHAVMHLRAVNPHLAAALAGSGVSADGLGGNGGDGGGWMLPRAVSGQPLALACEALVTGISAFAFQGTNAHVVLQRPAASRGDHVHGAPGGVPAAAPV
ncbi:hypothetical protein VaNZ11_006234, partial [Volvox africanus]